MLAAIGAIEAAGNSSLNKDAGIVAGFDSIGVSVTDDLQKIMEKIKQKLTTGQ